MSTTEQEVRKLRTWGLQSRLAGKVGVSKPTICMIFKGARLPTADQAARLEEEFTKLGINLNRWDLLYGNKIGTSLADYLKAKLG